MAYIRAKDRIGTNVNGFYIEDVKRENNRTYAYIICPYCKGKKWMRMESITSGKWVSCGCYNAEYNFKKPLDITGKISGRLKAIKPTNDKSDLNKSIIWECDCSCGNKAYVSASDFVQKRIRSCGCLDKENRIQNGKNAAKYVKDNFCIGRTNICAIKDKKIPKNNTSGVRGVYYDKFRQKWVAQIGFKGRNYYLGRYDKKSDAVDARIMAEKKLFENFLEWYAMMYPEQWKRINKTTISSDKIKNPKENVYQKYKDYNMDKLSEKQVRILRYRISGLTCRQISEIENVSEKTISNTLHYIKTKLDDDQQLEKLKNYQHDYYVRNNKSYKQENNTNRNIHYLHNLYCVMIVVNYKQYYIKYFKNIEEAIKMRDYVEKIRDENKDGFDEWYNDFVKNGREIKY